MDFKYGFISFKKMVGEGGILSGKLRYQQTI